MRKSLIYCCLLTACLGLVIGQSLAATEKASTEPAYRLADGTVTSLDAFAEMQVTTTVEVEGVPAEVKEQYYLLYGRADAMVASPSEIAELMRLAQKWYLPVPYYLTDQEEEPFRDGLDDGGPDTVANCASATDINALGGCPFNDTGFFDGDNDCSVIAASPYNEKFYTFVAPTTGLYQLRARSLSGGVAAVRVVSGGCCLGAVNVGFSSASIATDCQRPDSAGFEPVTVVVYVRAPLTAGVRYWIHVGTSASTASTAGYQFNLWCVGCPPPEVEGPSHNTCATASAIAIGDSVFGDSAFVSATTASDWYTFTKTGYDTIEFFVGGREFGHCLSGVYSTQTPSVTAIDGRFTVYRDNGSCPGDSVFNNDDGGCSFDAKARTCLGPGRYYVRIWNYGVQEYVFSVKDVGDCPAPIDCNTLLPCGSPTEIEPNNTCADAANFIRLDCTDGVTQTVYGTSCPQTDVDYFLIGAIPLGRAIDIQLYDGPNCDQPTGGLAMRGATGAGGVCAAATGTATRRYLIGQACYPTAGGYFGVVRASGVESPYKITVTCVNIAPVCPDVVLPKQFCSGPWVGPIVDVATREYSQTVVLGEVIDDLNVRFTGNHTFDGDVDIVLITPQLDSVALSRNRGSSGDNWIVTLFDDEAATAIGAGVAPFNGSFRPEELLSLVDGRPTDGTWTIRVRDEIGGDSGFVQCWCLEFTSHVPCTPTVSHNFYSGRDLTPQSACIEVCAGSSTLLSVCSTDGSPLLPDKPPVVSIAPGCDPAHTNCDVTCNEGASDPIGPIDPYTWGYNAGNGCWELILHGVQPGCVCVTLEDFLAVELTSFSATPGSNSVTLNWVTASEVSNDRFEIERDGQYVGMVDGMGSDGVGASYSWTDNSAVNGRTYGYSLVAVDANGSRSMLGSVNATPEAGAAVITEYSLLQNYPNPFNPETSISFDMPEAGSVNLSVFNLMGQKVATLVNGSMESGRHVVSFSANNMPSGIYLYRLDVNGFSAQKKMFLMK